MDDKLFKEFLDVYELFFLTRELEDGINYIPDELKEMEKGEMFTRWLIGENNKLQEFALKLYKLQKENLTLKK